MSGVAIVRSLLVNDATLTSSNNVPAARIRAGKLPHDLALPAISIEKISGSQHNTLAMNEESYLVDERVQVTIFTEEYPQAKTLLDLVLKAAPNTKGTIATFTCEGISPEAEGPDLYNQQREAYQQSQDFMVSWVRSAT